MSIRRSLCAVLGTVVFAVLGGSQALAVADGDAPPGRLKHGTAPARLDPRLGDIVAEYRSRGKASALATARRRSLAVSGDMIEVVVAAAPGRRGAVASALSVRRAVLVRSYGDLTKALVSIADLAGLAQAAGVHIVEPPQRAHVTALTGQGVAASNASVAHAAGDKGAGVEVGIVDVGFSGYTTLQTQGELPATVSTHKLCTDFAGSKHGTAVAEVVHDVAPEVELHLI